MQKGALSVNWGKIPATIVDGWLQCYAISNEFLSNSDKKDKASTQ